MITLYSSVISWENDQGIKISKKIKIHTISLFSNPSGQKVDFKIRSISFQSIYQIIPFLAVPERPLVHGPSVPDPGNPGWKSHCVMNLSLCLGNGNKLYSKFNFHNYGHVSGHEFFGFFPIQFEYFLTGTVFGCSTVS